MVLFLKGEDISVHPNCVEPGYICDEIQYHPHNFGCTPTLSIGIQSNLLTPAVERVLALVWELVLD
jgi:hypothetical protein